MRWLWKLILAITFVVVLLASILAVLDNSAVVALHFLSWQTPTLSIYWWLLISLIVGFVLGAVTVTFGSVKLKMREHQLRRQLKVSQNETNQLRNQSLVE